MLESVIKKYESLKSALRRELAFRRLAREINNAPVSGYALDYKAVALLLPAVAAVSCATSGEQVIKPELKGPESEPIAEKRWGNAISFWLDYAEPDRIQRQMSHIGIDYDLPRGTPVVAAANGIVFRTSNRDIGGKVIDIVHTVYWSTVYAHLDDIFVEKGDVVFRGMPIGILGRTGRFSNWPELPSHLHFGLTFKPDTDIDPKIYWAEWKKSSLGQKLGYTYDGIRDYDKEIRDGGPLKIHAPFITTFPTGNVNLEQIIKGADIGDDSISKFFAEPEKYKIELFNASLALIAKKQPKIAKDLAGLPMLNDGITKEEAFSTWKLYDAIKDANFRPEFATGDKKTVVKSASLDGELYILWGLNAKKPEKRVVRFGIFQGPVWKPYQIESDDMRLKLNENGPGYNSNVSGIDKDGVVGYIKDMPDSRVLRFMVDDKLETLAISKLVKKSPQYLHSGDVEVRAEFSKKPAVQALEKTMEDIIVAGKGQPWNFYLQEMIRYGLEKDTAALLKENLSLTNLMSEAWGKLPY